MKVNVWYHLGVEVDIPEEEIRTALEVNDSLKQGDIFNRLTQKYSSDAKNMLNNDVFTGEIYGVYNSFTINDNGQLVFANDDFEEVIWEG
mgnify:FL=1